MQVMSFTRIPTGDIAGLQRGAYILSALDAAGRDEVENYGFLLTFHPRSTTERVASYSMRSKPAKSPSLKPLSLVPSIASLAPEPEKTNFFAFKALRRDMIRLRQDGQSQIIEKRETGAKTAKATVDGIVARLREECEKVGAVTEGDVSWVKDKDLIG